MWPHPDGDEGALAEYERTDGISTFEDWLWSGMDEEEYAEWVKATEGRI